jgi:hypothetical protein
MEKIFNYLIQKVVFFERSLQNEISEQILDFCRKILFENEKKYGCFPK